MRASLTALAGMLLIFATLALGGCGLKGDLYLPEQPPPAPSQDDEDRERGEDG